MKNQKLWRGVQIFLAVVLLASGLRLLLIYRERHQPLRSPSQTEQAPLDADAYVVPEKLHAYDLKSARELIRKMLNGQEAAAGHGNGDGKPVYKLVNDDRVTRVGRWLRRTSLDEIPQLCNVVRGEMSLVGPRPPLGYELEAYDHWQFDRLKVLPGITGLWQVSGRNLLTYRQMCELDLEYVRRWSLWLDFKILVKTIPAVVFNSGRAA